LLNPLQNLLKMMSFEQICGALLQQLRTPLPCLRRPAGLHARRCARVRREQVGMTSATCDRVSMRARGQSIGFHPRPTFAVGVARITPRAASGSPVAQSFVALRANSGKQKARRQSSHAY